MKEGNFMREKSCMIVVPENEEDIRIEKVLARLENSNDIKMTVECCMEQ